MSNLTRLLRQRWNLFGRILLRLTALNTGVLLAVFILYNITLYLVISHQLYDNVDKSMQGLNRGLLQMTRNADAAGHPLKLLPPPDGAPDDPRILFVFIDDQDRLVIPARQMHISRETIVRFTAAAQDAPLNLEENGRHYRLIKFTYAKENLPQITLSESGGGIRVRGAICLANVDPEIQLLLTFMLVSTAGTLLVLLIIVGAGYFLARQALIPINESWEKQEQFVSNASHEMRTPLAVVKSHAELLLHTPDHTIEQESEHIAAIIRESTRLGNLVSKLLLLARADSNQEELEIQVLDLAGLASNVVAQFQPIAALKEIQLELDNTSSLEIRGDQDRLIQLLVILLDNAIKYTPAAGMISLQVQALAGTAQIRLTDTGAGISPEDLPRIFDRFYRADAARSGPDRGTGLGLAIAQWIVEKHRGTIKVRSKVGQGTVITVSLPLKKHS
ncbi:MAG TPA: ATP-binding protein [Patescibacteria group bacterium]|nr:ATP-binding protein [Patescibacteria group bacterium]